MINKTTLREYDLKAQELIAKIKGGYQPLPGSRTERIERQAGDFEYFLKTYLPHHFDELFSKSHRDYFEKLKIKNTIIENRVLKVSKVRGIR